MPPKTKKDKKRTSTRAKKMTYAQAIAILKKHGIVRSAKELTHRSDAKSGFLLGNL